MLRTLANLIALSLQDNFNIEPLKHMRCRNRMCARSIDRASEHSFPRNPNRVLYLVTNQTDCNANRNTRTCTTSRARPSATRAHRLSRLRRKYPYVSSPGYIWSIARGLLNRHPRLASAKVPTRALLPFFLPSLLPKPLTSRAQNRGSGAGVSR